MFEDKTDEKMSPIKKNILPQPGLLCFTFKFTLYFLGFRRDLMKKLDMLFSNKRFFMFPADLVGVEVKVFYSASGVWAPGFSKYIFLLRVISIL